MAHHAIAHLYTALHQAHASQNVSSSATEVWTAAKATSTSSVPTPTSHTGDSNDAAGDSNDAAGGSDSGTCSSGGTTSSSSNSALSTARQTLAKDVQTIELASNTTVGQLTAAKAAFQTLATDGLSASSHSALESFENSLVTAYASGTTLSGDATLLGQFEALYTNSPTPQQATDLTAAYNALAAAVISSNITSSDIATINTDWAAVLAAEGSTSTATFAYFDLVTGRGGLGGYGHGSPEGCS
jgi:hypothetical protein